MAQSKKTHIKNGDFKHCDVPFRYVKTFTQWPFQEPKLEVPTIYVWPIF